MRIHLLALSLPFSLALPGPAALGQSPSLLVDLDTGPALVEPDGDAHVVGIGLGRLWMRARVQQSDSVVYSLDALGSTPVPQPLPGANQSPYEVNAFRQFEEFVELTPARAVFEATPVGSVGPELFGLDASTFEAVPLGYRQTGSSGGQRIVADSGLAYFLGEPIGASSSARGIYRTDGTPAGTQLLLASFTASGLHFLNGSLIYSEYAGSSRFVLGVPLAGGAPQELLTTGPGDTGSLELINVNGGAVFAWNGPLAPTERTLYFTDATPAGTVSLSVDALGPVLFPGSSSQVLFSAETLTEGRELWRTDGTAAGTQLVADLLPGTPSGLDDSSHGAWIGSRLVFSGSHPGTGPEPTISDGTAAGTALIADLRPGLAGSAPAEFAGANGSVVFAADPSPQEDGLPFSTDGQTVTALAATGVTDLMAADFQEFAGRVYFSAEDSVGRELWSAVPGQTGSAALEADLAAPQGNASSTPRMLLRVADRGFFIADVGAAPSSLHVTDGSAAGTSQVRPDLAVEGLFGSLDRRALFTSPAANGELQAWITDGSDPGTESLGNLGHVANNLRVLGAAQLGREALILTGFWVPPVAFDAGSVAAPLRIWKTGGTPASTALLAVLEADSQVDILGDPTVFRSGPRVYVRARLQTPGGIENRLWSTDGTTAGTGPVAPLTLADRPVLTALPFGDRALLRTKGAPSTFAQELWVTDGSEAGTTRLYAGSAPTLSPTVAGERVVFLESGRLLALQPDGSTAELFKLEGDESLTLPISVGAGVAFKLKSPFGLTDRVIFTDGTVAGTVSLETAFQVEALGSGSDLLLLRATPELGQEPWVANIQAGTDQLAVDSAPGTDSSTPRFLGRVRDRLLFSAFTQAEGRELHSFSISAAGGFVAESFGQGCASAPDAALRLVGEARIGELVELQASGSPAGAPVAFYASAGATAVPLGSCAVYLSQALQIGGSVAGLEGTATLPFALQNAAFIGLPVFLQAAAAVPGGPLLGQFQATGALEIVIGQ